MINGKKCHSNHRNKDTMDNKINIIHDIKNTNTIGNKIPSNIFPFEIISTMENIISAMVPVKDI